MTLEEAIQEIFYHAFVFTLHPKKALEALKVIRKTLLDYEQLKSDYIDIDKQLRTANTENDELKRMLRLAVDNFDDLAKEEAAQEWNTRASGWIPCSERLPEKDMSVLISAQGHRVTAYYDSIKGVFMLTETEGLFYSMSAVTHWMQLPEVPQRKDDTHDND